MKKSIARASIQLGAWCLIVAAGLVLPTSIRVSAQSSKQQTRSRWEKLVYEDAKALIDETTRELEKNPQNALALRMRSSAYYRSNEPEKGKADAVAAFALLKTPVDAGDFEAKCYAERRLEKYDDAILSLHQGDRAGSKICLGLLQSSQRQRW